MSERPSHNPNIIPVTRPEQGGGSVTEQQIPHSGNLPEHLRERPVNDFNNTTLPEAFERQLLQTPTSPSTIPEALPAPEQKKSGKGFKIGISAGLAGAALIAGSIIGINAVNANSGEATPPVAEPTPSDVAPEPVAPETELTFEQQVEAIKIEAGLSAEEYADVLFEERLASWDLAGKEDYWERYVESDVEEFPALRREIADEQKLVYANALFQPGWQDGKLAVLAEQSRERNEIALIDWGKTRTETVVGGSDLPEWESGMIVERVDIIAEDPAAGTRKLFVAGYETNNGADTAQWDSINVKNNGAPWSFYVTTTVIDGTEYISDWSVDG